MIRWCLESMRQITVNQLRDILATVRSPTFIGAIVVTKVDYRKTGFPYRAAFKVCRINGVLAAEFGNAVLRQQFREGIRNPWYWAGQRSWGKHVEGSPALIEHKGHFYLYGQLNPVNPVRPIYLVPRFLDNRFRLVPVAKTLLEKWLPAPYDAAAAQRVERPVIHREYRLDSIVTLAMNGERYRVRP